MGGWLSAIGSMFTWLAGEGIGQSLVRLAISFGLTSYAARLAQKASEGNSQSDPKGVRQQIAPATENKLPVAYGESYFSGTVVDVHLTNENKEMYSVIALCEKTGDIFSTNPTTPGSRTMSDITIDDIYLNIPEVYV